MDSSPSPLARLLAAIATATPAERLTGAQCRAARAALFMTQGQLATAAAVSRRTVTLFEGGASIQRRTRAAIQNALAARGVVPVAGGIMVARRLPLDAASRGASR